MERKILVEEIIKFCIEYGIINKTVNESEIKNEIYNHLNDNGYIGIIINTLITRTRNRNDIDTGKLIEIITELEYIRYELEGNNYGEIEE
jgi:hypothetical protein